VSSVFQRKGIIRNQLKIDQDFYVIVLAGFAIERSMIHMIVYHNTRLDITL